MLLQCGNQEIHKLATNLPLLLALTGMAHMTLTVYSPQYATSYGGCFCQKFRRLRTTWTCIQDPPPHRRRLHVADTRSGKIPNRCGHDIGAVGSICAEQVP